MPRIAVGCSGWQYRHWRDSFYPSDLPASRWLEHYASRLDTVEVNSSFYRLPDAATFDEWRRRVPLGFVFALKASRYLTHLKRLRDPAEPVGRFFERATRLGRRLGPVLYQLPPRWTCDAGRLAAFLAVAREQRPARRQAIEFRDPSWYRDDVFALLERHRVALCVHDMAGSDAPRLALAPHVYLRLHGPQRYSGGYPDSALAGWAAWLADQAASGRDGCVYFNNDIGGHAPRDALRLRALLGSVLR
jgi:uncharacterized protein YecE (DUF72 family)